MFGLVNKKRELEKRLRYIENAFHVIKLCIGDSIFGDGKIDPDSLEGAIYGQAMNYLTLNNLDETIGTVITIEKRKKLEKSKTQIKKAALGLLNNDENLKIIIAYLLLEYSAVMSYTDGLNDFKKTNQWTVINEIVKSSHIDRSNSLDTNKFKNAFNKFCIEHGVQAPF